MVTIKMVLLNGTLTAEVDETLTSSNGGTYTRRTEKRITVPEDLTQIATTYDLSPRNYDWGPNQEAFRFYKQDVEQIDTKSTHWEPQAAMDEYLRGDFGPFIDLLDGKTFAEISSQGLPPALESKALDTLRLVRKIIILSSELGELLPDQEKKRAIQQLRILGQQIETLLQLPRFLRENFSKFEKLVNSFVVNKDKILRILSPFIAAKESTDTIDKINNLIDNGKTTIDETQKLLLSMRDKETREGTDKAATFYTNQAHKSFLISLAFLVGLGITVGGLILYLLKHHSDIKTWKSITFAQALSIDLPRLSYLSVFAFGIAFLARNYRINQHLMVLNRTKAITLSAGERFIAATEPQFRGQVTMVIVQSAFALGNTGFISDSSESTQDSSGILNRIGTTTLG